MGTNYNSQIFNHYEQKPVAFNPLLGRLTRSAIAGLFMSQLLYWNDKGHKKGWVYKTVKDFEKETCLTGSEQRRAIKKWMELGVLEKRLAGIPATRHFKVNIRLLIQLLDKQDSEKSLIESENKIIEEEEQDCLF